MKKLMQWFMPVALVLLTMLGTPDEVFAKDKSSFSKRALSPAPVIVGNDERQRTYNFRASDKYDSIKSVGIVGQVTSSLGIERVFPSGTGILINHNYVLTNAHVVADVSACGPRSNFSGWEAWFGWEKLTLLYERPWKYAVRECVIYNPYLDYAILRVERVADGDSAVEPKIAVLSCAPPTSGNIYVVGHPNGEGRQIASGQITETGLPAYSVPLATNCLLPISDGAGIKHNVDTLPGSSGSAVFDESTKAVVALNHAELDGDGGNDHSCGGGDCYNLAISMAAILPQIRRYVASVSTECGTSYPPTPTPTPPSGGTNKASYVADVTVPDGTTFGANQAFTKTWRIKNIGTATWGSGYHWTFDGGDQMGGPASISVPTVSPGATWDPTVNLQAPSAPGTYRGYWRMQAPDGTKFGTQVWVQIKVATASSTNGSAYVTDVNVPDGTTFGADQTFTKIWRIKNTGTSTWGTGYRWTFDGGTQMNGPAYIEVPTISPGATWDPTVNLQAPGAAGNYRGYWRMQAPDGTKFGTQVWVQINVTSGGGSSVTTYVPETAAAAYNGAPGFWRHGTSSYWHDAAIGDGGHMLWTYNNDPAHGIDNMGDWRPNLPETRWYEVFVFIPSNYATTTQAQYEIYHADGRTDVQVNQNLYYDAWVSLGRYRFNSGTGGLLRLIDRTSESYTAKKIGFDSAKWEPRDPPSPTDQVTVVVPETSAAAYNGAPGFWRHGTSSYWHDAAIGDGGHMLWTYNNDPAHGIDNMGDWRPNLPKPAKYELFVYIPSNYATTTQARYEIYHADGRTDVTLNQLSYSDVWVSLGVYRFNSGTGGFLRLIDVTGEGYITKKIGFDSAKWVSRPDLATPNAPSDLQPRDGVSVAQDLTFSWRDNGMNDGNPCVDFKVQVWRVVNGQQSDMVWDSDYRPGTNRSWTAPGPGEYEWAVRAGNGVNQNTQSGTARFVVPAPLPEAPSHLSAVPQSATRIWLSWRDNSRNESGFKVERISEDGSVVEIGSAGADITSFTDTGLVPETTYRYRVRAYNDAGASPYSSEVSATTLATYPLSLVLIPNTVMGGFPSAATVNLGGPAPAGGTVVTLASSDSGVIVPVSITVPEGETSATFTINTATRANLASVTITASSAEVDNAETLVVLPSLLVLNLAPQVVMGGQSSIGTITLGGAAPAGGVTISLSSSASTVAVVPPSVTVLQGDISATFPINTPQRNTAAAATISATLADLSSAATLTVNASVPTITMATPTAEAFYTNLVAAKGTASAITGRSITKVTARLYRYASGATPAGYWAGSTNWNATFDAATNWRLCTGTTSWSLTLPTNMAEGKYFVQAVATDSAGRTASTDNRNFTIDRTLPMVTITAPVNNSVNQGLAKVMGTASDNIGVQKVTALLYRYAKGSTPAGYWAGGDTWTPTVSAVNNLLCIGTTAWSLTLPTPVAEGRYSVRATSYDATGNTATSETRYFTVDLAAPSVAITVPINNSVSRTLTRIVGTASDGIGVQKVVALLYRNASGGTSAGYWNRTAGTWDAVYNASVHSLLCTGTTSWLLNLPTPLAETKYSVRATATDLSNRSTITEACNFTIDLTPPSVVLTTPANNGVYGALPAATGTASDGKGLQKVMVSLYRYANGSTPAGYWNPGTQAWDTVYSAANLLMANGTASWNCPLPALAPGKFKVRPTAYDFAGNTATVDANFTIKPPALQSAIGNGSEAQLASGEAYVSSSSVQLTFPNALDNKIGPANFVVAVNGVIVEVQGVQVTDETVTLLLPSGELQAGDSVSVVWHGLQSEASVAIDDGEWQGSAQ